MTGVACGFSFMQTPIIVFVAMPTGLLGAHASLPR